MKINTHNKNCATVSYYKNRAKAVLCIFNTLFHVKHSNRFFLVAHSFLVAADNKKRAKAKQQMLKNGKITHQQKPCHKVLANVKSVLGYVK